MCFKLNDYCDAKVTCRMMLIEPKQTNIAVDRANVSIGLLKSDHVFIAPTELVLLFYMHAIGVYICYSLELRRGKLFSTNRSASLHAQVKQQYFAM